MLKKGVRFDVALVLAKAEHRGSVLEYNDAIANQLKMSISLQYALTESSKTTKTPVGVYLQPKFDTVRQKVVVAEALARWKKDGQFVSPTVFTFSLLGTVFCRRSI